MADGALVDHHDERDYTGSRLSDHDDQGDMSLGRFKIVLPMSLVMLIYFAAIRGYLMGNAWSQADLSLPSFVHLLTVGFLYDLAFIAYALIPVVLYLLIIPVRVWRTRAHRLVVHMLCFIAIYALGFSAVAEILFWDEFAVRFNFISVDYLVYRREVTDNIVESYPLPWLLTVVLVITTIVYLMVRRRIAEALQATDTWRQRAGIAVGLWTLPVLVFVLVDQHPRQGFANNFQKELASNGPYQMIAAFRNNELDYMQWYPSLPADQVTRDLRREVAEAEAVFTSDAPYDIRRRITAKGPARRLNVVLIMVESLSAKFLGAYGDDRGLTPRLDALADQSLVFERFYATGTRTTRGLEAVTLSMPPTPGRSIVKRLGKEKGHWSLGNVLREQGYQTAFLYGGRGYFDNMNSFFAGNGYDVVDLTSMPDEDVSFTNAWGMADEDLYRLTLRQADSAFAHGKPFFFHVMTTSNHRPYTYPEGRIDIPSGTGRTGAVKYSDWALGDFVDRAREKPWFDDTLFVILGDHTAGAAGKTDLPVDRYWIPMLVYGPAQVDPDRVPIIASQIDLAPTLLAMLNISYESVFFGKNALNMEPADGRAVIGTYQHLGLYSEGVLSVLTPQGGIKQQLKPERKTSPIRKVDATDPHVKRTIAFYQGAAQIFTQRLNAWPDQTETTPRLEASAIR